MEDSHDDAMLMVPPPGYKFIPRYEAVCGKPGCFECYDIYCERCESKDRRIIELELRNNDLVKYITQLQRRFFGTASPQEAPTATNATKNAAKQSEGSFTTKQPPFAYIQSPVLYDPEMNLSYIATTTFTPQ